MSSIGPARAEILEQVLRCEGCGKSVLAGKCALLEVEDVTCSVCGDGEIGGGHALERDREVPGLGYQVMEARVLKAVAALCVNCAGEPGINRIEVRQARPYIIADGVCAVCVWHELGPDNASAEALGRYLG